jgi:hypothetical protein
VEWLSTSLAYGPGADLVKGEFYPLPPVDSAYKLPLSEKTNTRDGDDGEVAPVAPVVLVVLL